MGEVSKDAMRKGKTGYGGRGRPWHPDFIAYMSVIANHPSYRGMPDAFVDGGRIQWEAPSNRKSGRFKDTHVKRLRWWQAKAKEIGDDPNSPRWISRTARAIHPTKEKPCKMCGRVLSIRYLYPRKSLFDRIRKLSYIGTDYSLEALVPITDIVRQLVQDSGDQILRDLPALLRTSSITPPQLKADLATWLSWLEKEYIPREPGLLSPGAMSNAPDRFDGFHSDNLCCRHKWDKGRSKSNLATYVTDRRVFEFWSEGNWIAADHLIGKIRSTFAQESCANGQPGPCDADHIGPISLGFTHYPRFRLLCGRCNSAKNNRLRLWDVRSLLQEEAQGVSVVSWHSKKLWDLRKNNVATEEQALRLSKLMRDNRHSLMWALSEIAQQRHFSFLTTLLELPRADYDVEFVDLQIVDHVTIFSQMVQRKRETKYAAEQKARRCRIALQALLLYFTKQNRSAFVVKPPTATSALNETLAWLAKAKTSFSGLDEEIGRAVTSGRMADERLKKLMPKIQSVKSSHFAQARQCLQQHMDAVGESLSQMWDHERYVRETDSES